MTAALIPQVWVQEARADHLASTVDVLAGIAADETLPLKTRQAAQTAHLLLGVIGDHLTAEIARAEQPLTLVAVESPDGG